MMILAGLCRLEHICLNEYNVHLCHGHEKWYIVKLYKYFPQKILNVFFYNLKNSILAFMGWRYANECCPS